MSGPRSVSPPSPLPSPTATQPNLDKQTSHTGSPTDAPTGLGEGVATVERVCPARALSLYRHHPLCLHRPRPISTKQTSQTGFRLGLGQGKASQCWNIRPPLDFSLHPHLSPFAYIDAAESLPSKHRKRGSEGCSNWPKGDVAAQGSPGNRDGKPAQSLHKGREHSPCTLFTTSYRPTGTPSIRTQHLECAGRVRAAVDGAA